MTPPDSIRVQTEHLRPLSSLKHDLLGNDMRVLLPAGGAIDEKFKSQLLASQIDAVLLHPEDAAAMFISRPSSKTAARTADSGHPAKPSDFALPETAAAVAGLAARLKKTASSLPTMVRNEGPPLRERTVRAGRKPYSSHQQNRLTQQFATVNKLMGAMVRHAIAGMSQDKRAIDAVIHRTCSDMVQDSDQTIASSHELQENPEALVRATRMAVLGLGMAIELGWDEQLAEEVGTCGLVHDWGIYRLPEELRHKRSPLTPSERKLYEQHPLYTFEMLQKVPGVSENVLVAATQVHERFDGSGYPLGLKGEQIHPYAEILFVADAYVSLTEESWGRPAFVPYDAVVYLLTLVKQGRVKSEVMRALLETVALFPIGSHVRLSDGGEARVIRRGNSGYATPVVQRVEPDRTIRFDVGPEKLVDLSTGAVQVADALPHPLRHQQRMGAELHHEDLLR